MTDTRDWLEQTWDIKGKLARQYEGKSASEQLHAMRQAVLREWEKRGWTLDEAPTARLPSRGA